ncbi:MAG TPA: acetylglutamate kinase [Thermoanaerobaculia bacterium]|nr:acetylglutamate kinase [Thermoanaerobaculia bacterium]
MKVMKLGGSLLDDAGRRAAALREVAELWNAGEPVVLVHGGGKHVDAALAKLGIPKRTHAGLRITDDATLEVVVSVLGGSVNKSLVAELTAMGIRSAGVSGSDASILVAERHPSIDGVDLGHVGRVTSSDKTLLHALLMAGILPVVSSVAQGPEGTLLNVNADSAAAAIASSIGAHELRFITDVAGLLDGQGRVVPFLTHRDARGYLETNIVTGGMRPKLEAALSALNAGVSSILIGTGTGGTSLVAA